MASGGNRISSPGPDGRAPRGRASGMAAAVLFTTLLASLVLAPGASGGPTRIRIVHAPGRIVPIPASIPHQPGAMIDRRLIGNLRYLSAHFAISIKVKSDLSEQLNAFKGHLQCTVPRDGVPIEEADLSGKVGWIFGGEGRGLSEETLRQVPLRVTIPMASGTESLNVAAAAAICLFETFRRNSGTEP